MQIRRGLNVYGIAKVGQFTSCHSVEQQEPYEWLEHAHARGTDRELLTFVHECGACLPP